MNLLTGVANKICCHVCCREIFQHFSTKMLYEEKFTFSHQLNRALFDLRTFFSSHPLRPYFITRELSILLAVSNRTSFIGKAAFSLSFPTIVNNRKPLEECFNAPWRLPCPSSTIEARIISALLENFPEQRQSRCKQEKFPSPGELPVAWVLYQKNFSRLTRKPQRCKRASPSQFNPSLQCIQRKQNNSHVLTSKQKTDSHAHRHRWSSIDVQARMTREKETPAATKGEMNSHDQTFKSIQFLCRDFEELLSRLSLSETFFSSVPPSPSIHHGAETPLSSTVRQGELQCHYNDEESFEINQKTLESSLIENYGN